MAERSRMAVGVLVLDAEPGVPHGCSEIDIFEIRRSAPLLEKLLRPRKPSHPHEARDGLIALGSKWCAERRSARLVAASIDWRVRQGRRQSEKH